MAHLIINFPDNFQEEQLAVLDQYLIDSRQLTSSQWVTVLRAFDRLKHATAQWGTEVHTFRTFYSLWVDKVYADNFLKNLKRIRDLEREGVALQATVVSKIIAQLKKSVWIDVRRVPDSLYLQAYCIYWWNSFAKGYLFEEAVFRHLSQSGVRFWAHDFTQSAQRYTSFDLIVNSWQGDIRTSTYFLHTARTQTLKHAFYITRLWHYQRRKQVWAVVMSPDVWSAIDGDTEVVELSQASGRFPAVSRIHWRNRTLIVAEYMVWLIKILDYQEAYDE